MKGWGTTNGGLDDASPTGDVSEGTNGPEDKIGSYTYIFGSDGKWTIDATRSTLIQTVLGSNGDFYTMTGSSRNVNTGVVVCSTTITVRLARVQFYTDGTAPDAVFSFASSADCALDDEVGGATVGWKGNSAGEKLSPGTSGTEAGTTVERDIELPTEVLPSLHPIWIKFTQYGFRDTGVYAPAMTFGTN